jgi:formate dehydrogenase
MSSLQLGIRKWLEERGHEFVVTSDKEGSESVFQKNIVDVSVLPGCPKQGSDSVWTQAEVLITTPFHPGYLTRDLVEKVRTVL